MLDFIAAAVAVNRGSTHAQVFEGARLLEKQVMLRFNTSNRRALCEEMICAFTRGSTVLLFLEVLVYR